MTPGDNIYILLITAFNSFFWSEFYFPYELFISYTVFYIRLGPPAMVLLSWLTWLGVLWKAAITSAMVRFTDTCASKVAAISFFSNKQLW